MSLDEQEIVLESEPLNICQKVSVQIARGPRIESASQPFRPKGKFKIEHIRDGKVLNVFELPNGIVDVGLNHILDTQFNGGTAVTTWYIGLIDNASYTSLNNADTSGSHSGWIESSDYAEANRPTWTSGAAAARSITNAATVDFTINATKTIRGIFIISNNTKGGSTGVLWSTAAFGSTVNVASADVLKVTYTLSG